MLFRGNTLQGFECGNEVNPGKTIVDHGISTEEITHLPENSATFYRFEYVSSFVLYRTHKIPTL